MNKVRAIHGRDHRKEVGYSSAIASVKANLSVVNHRKSEELRIVLGFCTKHLRW